ncbi:MAG: hypothetical protein HQ581_08645 [Planctomycetes bacterium]|nr:hypothetical protein [Planctomycetota bacterium]
MRFGTMLAGLLVVAVLTRDLPARKWTSSGGGYTVEAEFVDVADGAVQLKREDGAMIKVPLGKLSQADRNLVLEHPLTKLRSICGKEFLQDSEIGRGFNPTEVKNLTKNLLMKRGYWIYVAIPGDKANTLVPCRGEQLKPGEVGQLADFLAGCSENMWVAGGSSTLLHFGGKTADLAQPTLTKALSGAGITKLPEEIFLRFDTENPQLVVSFQRNPDVTRESVRLHPDWKR